MKKIVPIRFLYCFLLFLLLSPAAKASHIYGADFYYTFLGNFNGNERYKISLVMYGDCNLATGSAYLSLSQSQPEVIIFKGLSRIDTVRLAVEGPGVEVTPVCPGLINGTRCKSIGGTIPGVTRFTYSKVIDLDDTSPNWRFYFTGSMGTVGTTTYSAGRTGSITNIQNVSGPGGSVMVLEATLNNVPGPNSSPVFTTIPTPFYCVNVAQQYNQGSVDPNNDSLAFSLAPALENGGQVTYQPGYSAINPLSVSAGTFSFNSVTGQMQFTPNIQQQSTVVNKVTEYRNGTAVGTASREMTFIVQPCNNNPPTGSIDTTTANPIVGGIFDGDNTINVCEGTPVVNFRINPADPDGDTISVTINGLPAGVSATISNNNTQSPAIDVNWPTGSVLPGTYSFFVTYTDRGCPLSSQQTIAYSIRIVRPNHLVTAILYPTQCVHQAYVQYTLSNGLTPRKIVVRQGTTIVRSYTTSAGVFADSLGIGSYIIDVSSPNLPCPTQFTLEVVDSGVYPNRPDIVSPVFYCLNDPPAALIATADPGATLTWYSSTGTTVSGPPTPSTATAGIFTWSVDQLFKVCRSLPDTFEVYVTKRPVASIDAPPNICSKDTINVSFNGSVGVGPILDYQWTWDSPAYVNGAGPGPWRVKWNTDGVKTITLQVFENHCPSTPVSRNVSVTLTPPALFTWENTCGDSSALITYDAIPLPGTSYTWDFDGGISDAGNTAIGPHNVRWTQPGTKHIMLATSRDGCTDTARATLEVFPVPDARILTRPEEVCYGDKVYLIGTGQGVHTWTPADRIMTEPDGRVFTRVVTPTTYYLQVTNQYNCSDFDSVRYDQIEPCCNFSYPNAFSPNDDAKNDRFRVLTYGNTEHFEFSIYDRWGKRVFWSFDPRESWDGTYEGKPCEMGTYFYYLKARCLTGREEEHKGDLTLVR